MAKTEAKIRGRVGNTVFYQVGKETRVRSCATESHDPRTPEQQQCRSLMGVATRFYQRMAETPLREIWKVTTKGMSLNGFNFFMKLNMNVFMANGKIGDHSRLQLVIGMLQGVNRLTRSVDGNDMVTLTWEDNSGKPSARKHDRLRVVVLYGNRSFTPVFVKDIVAERGDGEVTFRLERKRGTVAHLYCFFGSEKQEAYSSSQYVRV